MDCSGGVKLNVTGADGAGHFALDNESLDLGQLMRISVATGQSVRFLLDSGNGRSWTPGSALLDTHSVLPVDDYS